jgi:hypothetical protein
LRCRLRRAPSSDRLRQRVGGRSGCSHADLHNLCTHENDGHIDFVQRQLQARSRLRLDLVRCAAGNGQTIIVTAPAPHGSSRRIIDGSLDLPRQRTTIPNVCWIESDRALQNADRGTQPIGTQSVPRSGRDSMGPPSDQRSMSYDGAARSSRGATRRVRHCRDFCWRGGKKGQCARHSW